MNNTFSLDQKSRIGNIDANLKLRQHKLDLLARALEVISIKPKMKQNEITKVSGFSSSTLELYRTDLKMQSPYKSNNPKKSPKTSNSPSANSSQNEHDLKKPQITSNKQLQTKEVVMQVINLVKECS